MSNFASTIISGNTLNAAQLVTELDAFAVHQEYANTTDLQSSASTTWVTQLDKALAVAADDIMLVLANCSYSVSDGASTIGLWLCVDDAQLTAPGMDFIGESHSSDTTGIREIAALIGHEYDQSGTVTFQLKFRRNSGSGTVYVKNAGLTVLKFKRAA